MNAPRPLPASDPLSPPADTPFIESRRRLAYYFAWASLTFLFLQLTLGFFLQLYSHPRAVSDADGVCVIHRTLNPEETDGSRLLLLDRDLKPRTEPLSLPDPATAVLPENRDLTLFFGAHAALLADGRISRSIDLGQAWDVLCALPDPGGAWIFGWNKGNVVARRHDHDLWTPEIPVAAAADVDRIAATRDGAEGPLVAWRERDTGKVKTALYDGKSFVPGTVFNIGVAEHWDVLLQGTRKLLLTYNRDDRTYTAVTLRLECCPDCPSPLEPRRLVFSEPALLLGRKVTGLAAAVYDDRLDVFVSRMSTLLAASIPRSTLRTEPGGSKFRPLGSEPLWRHVVAAFSPLLLIFSSLSMIFLGITLFRERSRLARGQPVDRLQPADFLSRAMAYILDHLLLAPFILTLLELMNLSPDDSLLDAEDPRFRGAVTVSVGLIFLYYLLMEWRFGWTLGKRILGLRVADLDGSRLTLRGALLRTLIRLLDAESLPLAIAGAASILFTKRRQRLGDLAGRTVVLVDRGPL